MCRHLCERWHVQIAVWGRLNLDIDIKHWTGFELVCSSFPQKTNCYTLLVADRSALLLPIIYLTYTSFTVRCNKTCSRIIREKKIQIVPFSRVLIHFSANSRAKPWSVGYSVANTYKNHWCYSKCTTARFIATHCSLCPRLVFQCSGRDGHLHILVSH